MTRREFFCVLGCRSDGRRMRAGPIVVGPRWRGSPPGRARPSPDTRGKPRFFIDGEPYTKPVFETYVPETKFFPAIRRGWHDVFSVCTNLGPGFSAPTWIGPAQWTFPRWMGSRDRVLEANPRGLLLPRIYLTTPGWWVDSHPEECQVLANGSRTYGSGAGHGREGKAYPSIVSVKWREETAAALPARDPPHAGVGLRSPHVRLHDHRLDERGMVPLEHPYERALRLQPARRACVSRMAPRQVWHGGRPAESLV